MSRFKEIALFLLLLILILAGCAWWFISSMPYRVASAVIGSDLPTSAQLIEDQSQWIPIIGDGYTLRAFDLPREFTDRFVKDCAERGFSTGLPRYHRLDRRLTNFIGRHIDDPNTVCSRLNGSGEVVIIAQSRLIYFFSES